jgi:molecular chaperone DnaK
MYQNTMIRCAESSLNERIDRAVIAVPAYFTDVQRWATAKAGELAGLRVERIINEPTAATLDVTVLELFEGVIDVKASSGNNHLRSKDFDEIIMTHLADARGDERALMRLKKTSEDCKIALSDEETYKVSLPFLLTGEDGKPVSMEKTLSRSEFEDWVTEKVLSTREPILSALGTQN